jgi:hypothetical protein
MKPLVSVCIASVALLSSSFAQKAPPVQCGKPLQKTPPEVLTAIPFLARVHDLSDGLKYASEPHVAVDGTSVYIVWREWGIPGPDGLKIAVSRNGGRSFSAPRLILASETSLEGSRTAIWAPDVAAAGGQVWVSFMRGSSLQIVHSRNGISFGAAQTVSTTATPVLGRISGPYRRMASVPGGCCVVWEDSLGGTSPVVRFLRIATPKFSDSIIPSAGLPLPDKRSLAEHAVTLSRPIFPSRQPQLFVHGSEVRVLFVEDQDPHYIAAICHSRNGGQSFDTLGTLAEADSGMLPERRRKGDVGGIVKPLMIIATPESRWTPLKFAVAGSQ